MINVTIAQTKRLRFQAWRVFSERLVFRDGLARTIGLTIEIKMHFKFVRRSVDAEPSGYFELGTTQKRVCIFLIKLS